MFFKKKSIEIKQESTPELNRFVEFLKTNKKIVVEISGHTDNKGKMEDNLRISKERAQVITDFLIAKGIKTDRLIVTGYGQKRPIGFNSDKEGRKKNNRIEYKIITLNKKTLK